MTHTARSRWKLRSLAIVAILALLAAACGGGEDLDEGAGTDTGGDTDSPAQDLSGETVEVAATWTGAEQERFQMVLDAFAEQTGAQVRFLSAGDDIAAYVGPRIEGGDPPDVAIFPQPGVVDSFAAEGSLIPIDDLVGDVVDADVPGGRDAGDFEGELYGLWWKAAQKSTVWYNVGVFEGAGVQPPESWDDLLVAGDTISDYGVAPYSIGADVGWPLSDLFENVYLRVAGPEKYDQLAAHEIPWTDQSVKDALSTMAELFDDPDQLAGGQQGALQTDFNGSVTQAFTDPPKGAMVFEGDFVGGIITGETDAELGADADFFDFPSIDGSEPAVVSGGDLAVLLDDSEGGQALIRFLATPEAAEIWAAEGGFISPNTQVSLEAYGDDVSRRAAEALQNAADAARYDLSDLQPTEFGATTGQGIWGILIDFLEDPSDVEGTAQALETAAKRAYGE